MYYTYVLRSLKNSKRYVGYTSKIPTERLKGHNKGDNTWTKQNRPFKLIYSEVYTTKTEAIKRERFLKSGQGRKFLDNVLSD